MSKTVTTLTFADLVDAVSDDAGLVGLSKTDVKKVIQSTFAEIEAQMAEGREIKIPGFGKFHAVERAARTGRNPATGETIQIPAKKSPKFTPGKPLKDSVAAG